MPLAIKRVNLADDGVPVAESLNVSVENKAEITLFPQWRADKFNVNPARISLKAPLCGRLDILFSWDEKGVSTAIEGANPYSLTDFRLAEPGKIQKIAANFGIPACDIAEIHYVKENDVISEASLIFREAGKGLGPHVAQEMRDALVAAHNDKIKAYLNAVVIKLEAVGLVPIGTANEFQKPRQE